MLNRLLTLTTHRIHQLPVLVLMPHSRCNCRCVMCDIWKANTEKREITVEELEKHIAQFNKLKVREVVFSGGEALMHSNLWKLCSLFRESNIRITILSTGLLLQKNATEIIAHCDEVIVSLDGSQTVHDKIRNVPDGFSKLAAGVKELKRLKPEFKISGRCVLQRFNYFDFENIVRSAKEMGLDRISFLAADVSTTAFNHAESGRDTLTDQVALNKNEVTDFEIIIKHSFTNLANEYASKFISERPEKMLKIVQYYKAINRMGDFPEAICNAPWVSAVVESDGSVMPCFFHQPYGNLYDNDFLSTINSPEAIAFRKQLNVNTDPICKKCVCSLKLGLTQLN